MKKIYIILILILSLGIFSACHGDDGDKDHENEIPVGWNGKSVTYTAEDIRKFGSATPAGTANYNTNDDTVSIWNIDASLDNYGGVQTPSLSLDFSKAVIFKMEVLGSYTQYIVKLAVEGESEYYYVLSDEGKTGTISVNVVDAMLSDKYRIKNTQPDPGYQNGWKYDGEKKNCSFHILAKGPDGEKQTAELVLKSISIFNDQPAVTQVQIVSNQIQDDKIEALKGSEPILLSAKITPDVTNKNILWSSADGNIAKVNANGSLEFVGVGETYISAISEIDQSKSAKILVNVKSGYEDPLLLAEKINSLKYDGNSADIELFKDLFNTTWAEDAIMSQGLWLSSKKALDFRLSGNLLRIDNYFTKDTEELVNEANNNSNLNQAFTNLSLGNGNALVYRNIGGKLYKENYSGSLRVCYATFNGSWEKVPAYKEEAIVIWENGDVKKFEIEVVATKLIASFTGPDFIDSNKWTIPDRTKQSLDPVVHSLSPARLELSSNTVIITQNKYPEAKYCFGGIVSNILSAETEVEIIIDVNSLNKMNDFVKTMWEIKVLYYDENKNIISSNPLKIESGNTTGLKTVKFTPAYDNFRIYLAVNGSDIGAQFSDAQMQIRSLKIHEVNKG
jgi:hypothetical protein